MAPHPDTLCSPREAEVLQLLADGYTQTAAAKHLWIAPCTVKTHVLNFRKRHKLPRGAPAAVAFAFRNGWIK